MKQRFEMRRSIHIPVEIVTAMWDEPIWFRTSDLTPRGAFVESEFLPNTGDHLVCSFDLGLGSSPQYNYCFFGEVTRVNLLRRLVDRGRPGFGVRFLDTTPIERLKIRNALRGLPPPVPIRKRRFSLRSCFGPMKNRPAALETIALNT